MSRVAKISLVLLLAGCASVESLQVPVVPASLSVPENQILTATFDASGVQIYTCNESRPGNFEWIFKAPEADLFDRNGHRIGKHYAGPTWEGMDGSKVVGVVKGRNDSPDQNAIPWLLLNAKANEGNGLFAKTESIQRINTAAGKAPQVACNQTRVGTVERIDYRATYYFYSSKL